MTQIVKRPNEVSPEQLETYLRNAHWIQTDKLRSVATIWNRQDDLDAEVVLPLSRSVKDYVPRLRDALAAIASFERRDVLDVINDIGRMFANVITVRVIHADTDNGTIPINDGVLLITKAKDLLSAAAQSLFAKRKYFTGKPTPEAKEYVDSLLLGQTEIGSYVVNVIAPAQEGPIAQGQAESAPLAKAVTLNLVTGLEALEKASQRYQETGSLREFEMTIIQGASANMCDALLGFSGVKRNRAFEIKVNPSEGSMFKAEPRTFNFDTSQVEILEKASSFFKDDYVLIGRTLTGYVTKLSKPKEDEAGTITLDTLLDGLTRKVRIGLSKDDYHTAVLAHDKKQYVRCSGDLHMKSKTASLLNPQGFRIVGDDDLF
ncbi:hypothetical protein [Alcaligenes phenolicus]|uniref:hypothetical protein n=1 Tax=Alcaligenes phenolicus TaxID=232846 RepID=UPI00352D826F